ncbi:DUF4123 domain-containing protein [Luteimonas sp. A501]
MIDPSRYTSIVACAEKIGLSIADFEHLQNLYRKYAKSISEFGPRLLRADMKSDAWKRLYQEAFDHQAASFIVSPEHASGLEEHLLGIVRMPQPDGGNLLFRFQDVVVLSGLASILRPAQERSLLGPASHWMFVDVCATPIMIESEPRSNPGKTALRLDQPQLDTLANALAPMTLIFQVNETDSSLLAGMSKCEQVRLIRARMHRARRHDLRRADDIALYCVLSLQLPSDFDRTGPVADALYRARKNGAGFGEEIDQVPLQQWRDWDEVLDRRLAGSRK